METKKLRKGCLFRFSDEHLTIDKKYKFVRYSDRIHRIFLYKNESYDCKSKQPSVTQQHELHLFEIEKWLLKNADIPFLYLDYWGFTNTPNIDRGLMRNHDLSALREWSEHHFRILVESVKYDMIIVTGQCYKVDKLFEVLV